MPERAPQPANAWDIDRIRADFPILTREVHGKPLVYFDTAATAHRPRAVIEAVSGFYRDHNANIHRGVHTLSQEATKAYETARSRVARFINAPAAGEVVFTRGTTESINLVANSYLKPRIEAGDEILITHMEHHANIVPWQMLCEDTGARLRVAPINRRGELEMDAFRDMLSDRVKLVGVVHISNALGTVNPVREMCEAAAAYGIPVLVDGAQALPHQPVDVQQLGCAFYCFSGHKMYGPTGIGGLWSNMETLRAMPPYQGGGEMISVVSFEGTTYADPPGRFEAGTPNIAGAIGLGAAVDYLEGLGMERVAAAEARLLAYATEKLSGVEGLEVVGQAGNKAGVISFTMDGIHPNDIGTLIDHYGIAIRTGHHCAMPMHKIMGIGASARASFYVHTTTDEVDALVTSLNRARKVFRL